MAHRRSPSNPDDGYPMPARGLTMKRAGVVVIVMAATLLAAGCGDSGGASGGSGGESSALESEVRGAMEMIGNFVGAREALKESRGAAVRGRACASVGDSSCAKLALLESELRQQTWKRLSRDVDFSRYSKRAYRMAMRRVEDLGLAGQNCTNAPTGWKC